MKLLKWIKAAGFLNDAPSEVVGYADLDLILSRSRKTKLSQFADVIHYLRQMSSPAPFAAERIQQPREYENSHHYKNL